MVFVVCFLAILMRKTSEIYGNLAWRGEQREALTGLGPSTSPGQAPHTSLAHNP